MKSSTSPFCLSVVNSRSDFASATLGYSCRPIAGRNQKAFVFPSVPKWYQLKLCLQFDRILSGKRGRKFFCPQDRSKPKPQNSPLFRHETPVRLQRPSRGLGNFLFGCARGGMAHGVLIDAVSVEGGREGILTSWSLGVL